MPQDFTVQVADGQGGTDTTSANFTVNGTNDAPALVLSTVGGVSATEQIAVALAPALTLSDIDSTTLLSATVQITGNYLNGEDVLSFTDPTGKIAGSFNTASGTLTLTAINGQTPTDADFQAALRAVTYTDTSDAPSTAARTVTFTVQDPDGTANGGADTTVKTTTIHVTAVNDAPVLGGPAPITSFSDGQLNHNANVTPVIGNAGGTLELTDGHPSEAASWFATNPVSVTGFTASFDYHATGDLGQLADGMAFILQGEGPSALGASGYRLGYASDGGSISGISPSVAVEFNLFAFVGVGTAINTNGSTGGYTSTGPVDFWDTGDTVNVALTYSGNTLTESLTDLVTGDTYSTSYTSVNLAAILGSSAAYVGFSAGTGGGVSTQTVSNFNFSQAASYTENQAPIAVDPAITLSDVDSATLAGATVQITGGLHSGEDLLAFVNDNSTTFGGIAEASYIAATGLLTLTSSGGATLAQWQNALQAVTYANSSDDPSADARTITFQADDGSGANNLSNTATATVTVTPVNDAPVLDYFDLTIAQGGTTVLTTGDFHITDPDSSSFFFNIENVQGGEFRVFNGANWVSAPTGGFTDADIAAGKVEFVQDGSSTTPSFTVNASDFIDAGPAINPTVDFTAGAANQAPVITVSNYQLISENFFGGAGDQNATGITYANGVLYIVGNDPQAGSNPSAHAFVDEFSTTPGSAPVWTQSWNHGNFFAVAADATQVYAAGAISAGDTSILPQDYDNEDKTLLVRFAADGTAGNDPSPALGFTTHTWNGSSGTTSFFGYQGVEFFQNIIATDQSGNTILYAVGTGQPASYDGYVIAEYDSSGTLLHAATDPLAVPGSSIARDAVEFNGEIWAVGGSWHQSLGEPTNIPTVWEASYDLSSVATHKDTIGTQYGDFYSAAVLGNYLYAVGDVTSNGGDYIIAKYDTAGDVVWSVTGGGSGADTLTGAVAVNGRLFVVGSTTTANGDTDAVLMEINPTDGSVISTQTFGGAANDAASAITTDGTYLYIAGDSKSFTNGGNGAGQDDAFLLTYAIGGSSATTAADTAVALHGISVSDADAGAAQIKVTLAVGHGTLRVAESGLDGTSTNNASSIDLFGSQAAIDAALAGGVTYTPDANYSGTDALTVTADDQGNTGTGGAQTASQTVAIDVTPVPSFYWTGLSTINSTIWNDPDNWDPAQIPTASDNVFIGVDQYSNPVYSALVDATLLNAIDVHSLYLSNIRGAGCDGCYGRRKPGARQRHACIANGAD